MHFLEILRFGTFPFAALGVVVWVLIALALFFDFVNGFHDAANSVATVVSTRVLSPQAAVLWAAFFNFVAFLVFPLAVAGTIAGDIVRQEMIGDNSVIAATLLAACGWNLLTWYLALPTSSSHALVGALVGAALVKTWDLGVLRWEGLGLTVAFIFVSPLLGMLFGLGLAVAVAWIFRHVAYRKTEGVFRVGQFLSAGWFSLNHGGNDAQKTMGIIFLMLIIFTNANPNVGWAGRFKLTDRTFHALQEEPARLPDTVLSHLQPLKDKAYDRKEAFQAAVQEHLTREELDRYEGQIVRAADSPHVPVEVVLACHAAIALGTMFGGWRIVKTMGQKIIRLRPVDGFCAETGAGVAVALATVVGGIPVSTTHTITGAIVGVGVLKRVSAVRWGVAGRVVWAWVLTIPGAALLAALSLWLLQALAQVTGWSLG
jgi:PiT family inorganic phosphate transporter